jgi:hypothetical protein
VSTPPVAEPVVVAPVPATRVEPPPVEAAVAAEEPEEEVIQYESFSRAGHKIVRPAKKKSPGSP